MPPLPSRAPRTRRARPTHAAPPRTRAGRSSARPTRAQRPKLRAGAHEEHGHVRVRGAAAEQRERRDVGQLVGAQKLAAQPVLRDHKTHRRRRRAHPRPVEDGREQPEPADRIVEAEADLLEPPRLESEHASQPAAAAVAGEHEPARRAVRLRVVDRPAHGERGVAQVLRVRRRRAREPEDGEAERDRRHRHRTSEDSAAVADLDRRRRWRRSRRRQPSAAKRKCAAGSSRRLARRSRGRARRTPARRPRTGFDGEAPAAENHSVPVRSSRGARGRATQRRRPPVVCQDTSTSR